MTVNHKPETALPWAVSIRSKSNSQSAFVHTTTREERREVALLPAYGYRGTPYEMEGSNFDYIAHTANAYPKLIETLKKLVDIEGPLPGNAAWGIEVSALLRELGELS